MKVNGKEYYNRKRKRDKTGENVFRVKYSLETLLHFGHFLQVDDDLGHHLFNLAYRPFGNHLAD